MTYLVNPNDRAAIVSALQDPDPENPVAQAIADRIQEFMNNLGEMAERDGRFPTELLLYRPETAFDEVVIRATLQAVAQEHGHEITVHWLPGPLE